MGAIGRILMFVVIAILTVAVGVWVIKRVNFLNNFVFGASAS